MLLQTNIITTPSIYLTLKPSRVSKSSYQTNCNLKKMNYCSMSFHLAYHDRHRSHSRLIELILNLIVLFHGDKVIKSHTMSTPHNLSHTRFQLINIQASYISCQNLEQILGHSNNFVYYKLIIFTQYQMHNSLYCLLNIEVSIPSIYSLNM